MTSTRLTALMTSVLACLAACTIRDPASMTSAAETGTGVDMTTSTSSGSLSGSSASAPTTSGGSGDSTSSGGTTTAPDPGTSTSTDSSTGSEPGTSTGGVSGSTGTGNDTTTTGSTGDDTGLPGAMCLVNKDCATNACLEFRDHDPAATCVDGPKGGNTRFPGTLLDFVTGAPLPATDVKVIGILSALTDPVNAQGLVTGTSDAAGIVDMTSASPVQEGIGVVAVISGGPLHTTCTSVAAPMAGVYGPMSERHDLWGLPAATLSKWSGLLAKDPQLAAHLPLGVEGGTLGVVRDNTGAPVANAVVQSVKANSTAKIRYLAGDGNSFGASATASSGVFVLLGPGLAERFEVAGAPEATATSGSAQDVIFVITLDLP